MDECTHDHCLDEMFLILRHPLRRRILALLWEHDLTFRGISQKCSPNHGGLGYHLRAMRKMVRHDPRGAVYTLTGEGRRAQESLIQLRRTYEKRRLDLKVTPEFNPVRYVEKLSDGDHALLLHTDEAVAFAWSHAFLKAGILRGMAAVYLVSERRMTRAARELSMNDIKTEELEKDGAFVMMCSEEWYLRRGKASADTIIANWSRLIDEKVKAGYRGIQAAGEADVFVENAKTAELLAYENKLGRVLRKDLCGLCMCGGRGLEPDLVMSLIAAHGHGVFDEHHECC